MDIDLICYFDLIKLFKHFGFIDFKTMYWMHPEKNDFDSGLRVIHGDKEINDICEVALSRGFGTIHLYFEHPILETDMASSSDDYDSGEDSAYKPSPANTNDDSYEAVEVPAKKQICAQKKKSGKRKDGEKKRATPKKKSGGTKKDSEDDSEEVSFEATGYASYTEQMRTPESTDDEASSRLTFPVFKESAKFGQVHLELGIEFLNLELFKNAVKDYNINLGREFIWKKNDKLRVRAVCKVSECDWLVYCAWNTRTKTYQIKTFVAKHTCCRVFQNKAASKGWVAKKLEQRLLTQPDLKRKQAFEIMKEDFQVHLNDKKVSRALKKSRLVVEGSEKDQYARLWDYLNELLRSNPGTTCKMDVIPRPQSPPMFERLYIYA